MKTPSWKSPAHVPAGAALLALVFAIAEPAGAQAPFGPRGALSVETRGGLAAPTEDFREGEPGLAPEPGVALGADLMVRLTPQIAAYGGFSWTMFDCDGALCAGNADFTSSGVAGGLKLTLPLEGTITPWLRGGALLHRLRFSNDAFSAESNRPLGLDAAAGVDIALGQRVSLTPALRYNRYTVDIDLGPVGEVERTVSFGNLDLAFHFYL
jgi:hypothetical protein